MASCCWWTGHRSAGWRLLRPLALVGSDQAIREVWRIALAALDDAFSGAPPLERLRLFDAVPGRDVAVLRQLAAKGVRSPLAHGAGRWFDALGALGLARTRSTYEGQVALEWNLAAESVPDAPPYPFDLDAARSPVEADLRPMVRAAVHDLVAGAAAAVVSARFHATMAEVAAAMVRRSPPSPASAAGRSCSRAAASRTRGWSKACADGWRASSTCGATGSVPPGDGGIALGQAVVADLVASAAAATGGLTPGAAAGGERWTGRSCSRGASPRSGADRGPHRPRQRARRPRGRRPRPRAGRPRGDTVLVHAGVALSIVREEVAAGAAAVGQAEEA